MQITITVAHPGHHKKESRDGINGVNYDHHVM